MSSTMTHVPVSADQRNLLARLRKQQRVTDAMLKEATIDRDGEPIVGVGNFSKSELSDWLEAEVFHNLPSQEDKAAIDTIFGYVPARDGD